MTYWAETAEVDAFYSTAPNVFFDLFSEWRQGRKPSLDNVHDDWKEIIVEALGKLDRSNPFADSKDIAREALRIFKARGTSAIKAVSDGSCPKCGNPGRFVRAALCCPTHGAYAGI